MLPSPASSIVDVTVETFEAEIINRSMETVVVVDIGSPRSPASKGLTAALEALTAEYGGRFVLAKVNADAQMEIAQSFQVRSIPTVIALKNGQPVSAFQGAQPEPMLRAFLDKIVPSANEERVKKARALVEAGDVNAARDDLQTALKLDPSLDAARLLLAEIAFRDNQLDDAAALLAQIKPVNQMNADFERIQAKLDAASQAADLPGAAEMQAKVDANPLDFETRMQLATIYAAQSKFEPAFQLLLDIVQKDRAWNDQAARKKLVEFFTVAQPEQPALVSRYRRALATTLN